MWVMAHDVDAAMCQVMHMQPIGKHLTQCQYGSMLALLLCKSLPALILPQAGTSGWGPQGLVSQLRPQLIPVFGQALQKSCQDQSTKDWQGLHRAPHVQAQSHSCAALCLAPAHPQSPAQCCCWPAGQGHSSIKTVQHRCSGQSVPEHYKADNQAYCSASNRLKFICTPMACVVEQLS